MSRLQREDGGQKLYNQFGRFSLVFVLASFLSLLYAETFTEFKRTQSSSFSGYKDDKDSLFDSHLKSDWEAYRAQKQFSLYEKPKPVNISSARHRYIKKIGPKVSIKVPLIKDDGKKKSVVKVVSEPKAESKDIEFDFFGTTLGFDAPSGLERARFYPRDQKGINNFFNIASSSEYENLIDEINRISRDMNLNDWGKYLLVKEVSEKIYSAEDDSKLLSWFIFNKMGYCVKIGLFKKHVVLLHYSDKIIYSTPNFKIDNKTFYVISNYANKNIGSVYTYEQNYPGANKVFDLSMDSLPRFKEDLNTKNLSFKSDGKKYDISYHYNQNLIDFMSTYPQADYETFFNAPMESKSYQEIALALKKHINGKKASVALNFVLNFVQNAFKYELDSTQFGREKVMFAQETLYYDKSDCEDRAILFSYLIKELFNIGVVGVKYKDHMVTGLYIPMKGDSVKMNTKRFVIADPTYTNAIVGQSMPKYKPKKPESFIVVNKATKDSLR